MNSRDHETVSSLSTTDDVKVVPWPSDLAFLQSALEGIEIRASRISLERRRDAAPESRRARRGSFHFDDSEHLEPHVLEERICEARAREDDLSEALAARLVLHREAGTFELGLDRLCRVYALDAFGRTVLLLGAAVCIAHRLQRALSALDADGCTSGISCDAILTFCECSFAERVTRRRDFGPRGALVSNDLVSIGSVGYRPSVADLLTTAVELTGRTFQHLVGQVEGVTDDLSDLVNVETPRATFAQLVIPTEDSRRILNAVLGHERFVATRRAWGLDDVVQYGNGTIILLTGAPGTGKTMTARAIAHRLGQRVFNVNIVAFFAHERSGTFIPSLFREARLANALLFFDECEVLFRSRRLGENPLLNVLLSEIENFSGVAVLASNFEASLDDALDRRCLVRVRFAKPDKEAREQIWRNLLPPTVPLAPDVDLAALAARHDMSGGSIKNAVMFAAARAIHEADDVSIALVTHAMLDEAAHDQCAGRRVTQADHDRAEREAMDAPRRGGRMGFGAR